MSLLPQNRTIRLTEKKPLVTGTLKGYDALMNLVLDDVQEVVRGTTQSPSFLQTLRGTKATEPWYWAEV